VSGLISVGGLVSGLDTNTLIAQLMQLERQPIVRIEDRISNLELQRDAIRGLRTTLTTLRNRMQDFRLNSVFSQFAAASSEEKVLTSQVSGENPVSGSFSVNVTQLASATTAQGSSVLGASINTAASLDTSGINQEITGGAFSINGVQFTVDPATQSLDDIISQINASAAGVTATYNAGTDTIAIANTAPGDTGVINFGASGDTSNFLSVLGATGATQYTNGSGSTEVTGTRHLGAIEPSEALGNTNFAGGAVTAGAFSINGVAIAVDPANDSMLDIVARINASDANVTASYDTATDTLRVVSNTLGSRTIRFGAAGDTSNFLTVAGLDTAVQTAGNDAQFTVNGGAVQTRSTNEIADVIGGVTVTLLSTGTSTVTVAVDDEAIIEDVRGFLDEFNAAISELRQLTANEGTLRGDSTLRQIENYLFGNIFSQVTGIAGEFSTLLDIGISTGEEFDSSATPALQLDEEDFRAALRDDASNVAALFANDAENGIADIFFDYLDEVAGFSGFLNQRARANGILDQQVQGLNGQIDRIEERLTQKEERLRRQFLRMEQMLAQFQNQGTALSNLSLQIGNF